MCPHVQFIVMDKVPHNLIPVNPLGLTITYLREDQAFTNESVKPGPVGAAEAPAFGPQNRLQSVVTNAAQLLTPPQ